MALRLYFHPLASYCWKALVALYEHGTAFEPEIVDLGDEASRTKFYRLWPIGKFPVLQDLERNAIVPESTIIIEYLEQRHPGPARLIPADPELAREVRLRDRFYDLYVHEHMQKIVGDRLRPADKSDPYGVDQARARLLASYQILDQQMAGHAWAVGDTFSMADCAAAPALYYANKVVPTDGHTNLLAYLERLHARPSFARVLKEAEPYFKLFPQ